MNTNTNPLVFVLAIIATAGLALYGYRFARAERYTLLDAACASGDVSRVALLLRLGADPNGVRDRPYYMDYGWEVFEPTAPLLVAASTDHADVVRLLLAKGANSAVRDGEGTTARELAGGEGHTEVVRILDAAQQTSTVRVPPK